MKRLFVFATLVVMAVVASGVLLAQSNPFIGTWKLNPGKSKYTSGAPPKGEMVTIQSVGDQDEITVTGTASDGSPISNKFEMPDKGGAGKVLAGPYDAVSGKVIDENTREQSNMKGGKEVLHLRAVVSKDGKTMAVTAKGTDTQGKPVSGVSAWEKQ
jgi:outer membrane lipoprotein SlyB